MLRGIIPGPAIQTSCPHTVVNHKRFLTVSEIKSVNDVTGKKRWHVYNSSTLWLTLFLTSKDLYFIVNLKHLWTSCIQKNQINRQNLHNSLCKLVVILYSCNDCKISRIYDKNMVYVHLDIVNLSVATLFHVTYFL